MPTTPPQPFVARRVFTDFDDLAEVVRGWDLDLCQLDRGSFSGELRQLAAGAVQVTDARMGRTLLQTGAPPQGLRTIGVPANRDVAFTWRGKRVTGDHLTVFPIGAELSAVSSPDFHVFTCSFPEALLAEVAEARQIDGLDHLCGGEETVRCSPSAMRAVRADVRTMMRTIGGGVEAADLSGVADAASRRLASHILEAIAGEGAAGVQPRKGSRQRWEAVLRAQAYLESSAGDELSVGDLCAVAEVSQRTLAYAFAEFCGVTPKAYILAYRLNEVRKALRSADARRARVSDIANRFGFWHMGQFAGDYRRRFGELPSQTLRRGER